MFKLIKFNFKSAAKFGVIGNTIIGIGLRGLGDSIQQNIEIKSDKNADKSYNFKRTCKLVK